MIVDRCRVGPSGRCPVVCTRRLKEPALTSLGGAFVLHVDVAPLPVLLQRAALLVAATAMVALEGLLHCENQKLHKISKHMQKRRTTTVQQ